VLNDLGVAFEGISPAGYIGDGLSSGGLGQGAPNVGDGGRRGGNGGGKVLLSALFPVVGLKDVGDRVTFTRKYCGSLRPSVGHPSMNLAAALACCRLEVDGGAARRLYDQWREGSGIVVNTRGNVLKRVSTKTEDMVDACVRLGMTDLLLPGDIIKLKKSCGRPLELSEVARVVGASGGNLFVAVVSQSGEGGSLHEGGGRAWCMSECDVVDGGFEVLKRAEDWTLDVVLERSGAFAGGDMKIVYDAVVRADVELDGASEQISSLPKGDDTIPFLERRRNSCNVVRLRVRVPATDGGEEKEGWISQKIRGGDEEDIAVIVGEGDGKSAAEVVKSTMRKLKASGVLGEERAAEVEIEPSSFDTIALEDDALNKALVRVWNQWQSTVGQDECQLDGRAVPFADAVVAFRVALGQDSGGEGVAAMNAAALELLDGLLVDATVSDLVIRSVALLCHNRAAAHGLPLALERIAEKKELLFTHTKRGFFNRIVEATATPTAPSSDEYVRERSQRKEGCRGETPRTPPRPARLHMGAFN
jgi:hypothetical protein